MKISNLGQLLAVAASVGTTAHAANQEVFKEVLGVYQTNGQKTSFTCGMGFYGYKGADGLTTSQAFQKSLSEVKALYPNYPWSEILAVADEVKYNDPAIAAGTNCTEYVYNTTGRAMALVVSRASDCQGLAAEGAIDLGKCLRDLNSEITYP